MPVPLNFNMYAGSKLVGLVRGGRSAAAFGADTTFSATLKIDAHIHQYAAGGEDANFHALREHGVTWWGMKIGIFAT